jgi:hypothetical protein
MRFDRKIRGANKMEKLIWNAIGVFLFIANIWAMVFCFASGERLSGLALIALACLGWLYKEKRPTWIEV